MSWINDLGAFLLTAIEEAGNISFFFKDTLRWAVRPPFRYRLLLEQFIFVGNKSLFIIGLTAMFTGMVFAMQTYFGFKIFNGDALVGPVTAIALVRELAPVFTAIVVTGRCGAAMTAQLGTMRVTEQIDAMDVMAVNSIQYLVVPRLIGSMLALPLLVSLFIFVGNFGSYITGVYILKIDSIIFFAHLQDFATMKDIYQGLIKAAVFGGIFSTIGTYKGYYTSGGAEAVGRSTNEAVVITLVLILVSDYFVTVMVRALLYGHF